MKVLVTGHHGYIGSVLTPLVAEAGHEVTGLDSYLYRGCDLGTPAVWEPAVERDVRDVAVEDLAAAHAIHRRARETGAGTWLEWGGPP